MFAINSARLFLRGYHMIVTTPLKTTFFPAVNTIHMGIDTKKNQEDPLVVKKERLENNVGQGLQHGIVGISFFCSLFTSKVVISTLFVYCILCIQYTHNTRVTS